MKWVIYYGSLALFFWILSYLYLSNDNYLTGALFGIASLGWAANFGMRLSRE